MLKVNQLYFDYADKSVLRGVQFSLEAGCVLHVQGPNGSGKTTLLKLLAGLLCPTQGDVCYQGRDLREISSVHREAICYLGHKTGVSGWLTPREHWFLDLSYTGMCVSFDAAVEQLALYGVEDTPCRLLSAGLLRRVSLLRVLASRAALWLLDEPLTALDQQTVVHCTQMIQHHTLAGGSVIVTSHQPLPLECSAYQVYVL